MFTQKTTIKTKAVLAQPSHTYIKSVRCKHKIQKPN